MLNYFRRKISRFFRVLSAIGAAIIGPIERVGLAITRAFFSVSEGAEGFFDRIASSIFLPVRVVGRGIATVGRSLISEAVRAPFDRLGIWLFAILASFFNALIRASEALNLDRPILWLLWLLQPLWRPFAALGGFAYTWFVTRQWRQMVWGLPAVVMLLPFALVWGHTFWVGNGPMVSRYRLAVKEALEQQDYNRVQLYERKLAQLGVDTQLTEYRTAVALAEEDKLDEAYQRMQLLAPEEQPSYPSAHFWIVQRLMNGQLVEDKKEARRLAKVHLDHLETLEITGPYQQLLRAVWLVQDGQLEEATTVLKPLVSVMPNAAFERMRIDLALRRPEQAREDARALVTHMTTRQRRGPELDPTELQWWLAAEEVLGNLQQMRTILDQWHALEPENEQTQQAMAKVCLRQAAQRLRDPLPNQQQIVELWLTAAELDNSSDSLLQLARAMYRDREQTPVYGRVLEALHQSPRTPAGLLIAVGTEAAIVQRYDDARQFLAAAVARDATNPIAWNNYGLVLGEGKDARLDEALVAINRALDLAPNEHRFRETRGQILLRLERWPAAIEDLEFALNRLPTLDAIHQSLAVAYAALGQDELAHLHQIQVE